MDKRLARCRRYFEYHCYEGEDSSDAELWHHTHQQVEVIRKLRNIEEVDEADYGRMYEVKFPDGLIYNVCDDELVKSPTDYYRPDYNPIMNETKNKEGEQITHIIIHS